jgi:hypothetical protein
MRDKRETLTKLLLNLMEQKQDRQVMIRQLQVFTASWMLGPLICFATFI